MRPLDTTPEAHEAQLAVYRRMSAERVARRTTPRAVTGREIVRWVVEALERAAIPYMVVGSYAYLALWAETLGLTELWERARASGG